ncbi:unnamed protein product, partial [marine sediment metagenome]
ASATGSGIPGGINTVGLLRVLLDQASVDTPLVLTGTDETLAAAPSLTIAPLGTVSTGSLNQASAHAAEIDVDTSRQIRVKMLTDNSLDLHIVARGFIDRRGRDD